MSGGRTELGQAGRAAACRGHAKPVAATAISTISHTASCSDLVLQQTDNSEYAVSVKIVKICNITFFFFPVISVAYLKADSAKELSAISVITCSSLKSKYEIQNKTIYWSG